jgi:hypothetical protein
MGLALGQEVEMRLRSAAVLILAIAFATIAPLAPLAAQEGPQATGQDLERLQDDLENLDDLLSGLEPNDPTADGFRTRAERLAEEVVYLKVKMRRHQAAGGTGTGVSREEVDRTRRDASALREDVERAFGGSAIPVRTLAAGTQFTVRLGTELSSKTARVEDRFEGTVDVPVHGDQGLALPAGTTLMGIVRRVEPAERPSKSGRLDLDFYALYLGVNRLEVRARVVQIGPVQGKGSSTGKKVGIGGALGGVLGAILGGGTGAVIGVVSGGAGAVLGTKGDEVVLPEGTRLTVRLERTLDLTGAEP